MTTTRPERSSFTFDPPTTGAHNREESWAHGYPRNDTDSSLLLSVRLRGEPGSYSRRHRLRLVARIGSEVVMDRDFPIGSFNATGEYTIPVFVNGPFCAPVEARATLETTDGLTLDQESFEVSYSCGE